MEFQAGVMGEFVSTGNSGSYGGIGVTLERYAIRISILSRQMKERLYSISSNSRPDPSG